MLMIIKNSVICNTEENQAENRTEDYWQKEAL